MPYTVILKRALARGDALFKPGVEYAVSDGTFEHLYGHRILKVYRQCDPPIGPLDGTRSGKCVVVGGGPSVHLPTVHRLKSVPAIVCGPAHLHVPWAEYAVVMDADVFLRPDSPFRKQLAKFNGTVFTRDHAEEIHPKAVEVRWADKSCKVSDSFDEGVHGRNSGMAAVNIAYLLGFTDIGFVGLDCEVKESAHFYGDGPWSRAVADAYRTLVDGWRDGLDGQAENYAYRGVRVVNLGGGTLTQYEKMDWHEWLNDRR